MAASKQSNAITLKGSTEMVAEFFSMFEIDLLRQAMKFPHPFCFLLFRIRHQQVSGLVLVDMAAEQMFERPLTAFHTLRFLMRKESTS